MTEAYLLEMPLHKTEKINDGLYVTRVPGGWIYAIIGSSNLVFVPEVNFNI